MLLTQIQRFPEGLLPLLQLQTSGIPPQRLVPEVGLGVDGLPFYSLASDEVITGSVVNMPVAGSFGTSLTVPQGEYWLLHHAAARFSGSGTASGNRFAWALVRNGALAYLPGEQGAAVTLSGVGAAVIWTWQPSRLVLLRPGDFFQVENSDGAAATSCTVSVLATRLRT